MNNDVVILPDNIQELLNLVKSRAVNNPEEELLGLLVGSCFDSDGDICNELINHMIDFIKANPSANINNIYEHLLEILPDAEYIDDDESA